MNQLLPRLFFIAEHVIIGLITSHASLVMLSQKWWANSLVNTFSNSDNSSITKQNPWCNGSVRSSSVPIRHGSAVPTTNRLSWLNVSVRFGSWVTVAIASWFVYVCFLLFAYCGDNLVFHCPMSFYTVAQDIARWSTLSLAVGARSELHCSLSSL